MMRDVYGSATINELCDAGPICIVDLYSIIFHGDYPRKPSIGETPPDPQPGQFQWMTQVPWYLSGGDLDVTYLGITYQCELPDQSRGLPLISRGEIRYTSGTEVAEMTLKLECGSTTRLPDLLPGVPGTPVIYSVPHGARMGAFDGAYVKVVRVISNKWSRDFDTTDDPELIFTSFCLFEGIISGVQPTSYGVELTVSAETDKFNMPFPKFTITNTCQNALYDSVCNLTPIMIEITTSTGSDDLGFYASCPHLVADGPFNGGSLHFDRRLEPVPTIRTIVDEIGTSGFNLSPAAPVAVPAGWGVHACKGCTKVQAQCAAYGNINNYNAFPYVPQAETSI